MAAARSTVECATLSLAAYSSDAVEAEVRYASFWEVAVSSAGTAYPRGPHIGVMYVTLPVGRR
jgi:hypothetical protein